MNLKPSKNRKRFLNRITRRASKPSNTHTNSDQQIEASITRIERRAYNLGNKLYNTTQSRKAEGKEILKQSIKHGIGETTRAFLGPSKHKPKPKPKQKSTNNSLFQIFRRKK